MNNISVIGAGTMGNGIAHTFAQKGFNVNLVDISANALEKAISTIGKNLDRMVQKEKITEQEKSQTLSNITTFTDIPGQTGLGSSSAFAVGLVHALHALKGQMVTKNNIGN